MFVCPYSVFSMILLATNTKKGVLDNPEGMVSKLLYKLYN